MRQTAIIKEIVMDWLPLPLLFGPRKKVKEKGLCGRWGVWGWLRSPGVLLWGHVLLIWTYLGSRGWPPLRWGWAFGA